jgi:hypothetical protein
MYGSGGFTGSGIGASDTDARAVAIRPSGGPAFVVHWTFSPSGNIIPRCFIASRISSSMSVWLNSIVILIENLLVTVRGHVIGEGAIPTLTAVPPDCSLQQAKFRPNLGV